MFLVENKNEGNSLEQKSLLHFVFCCIFLISQISNNANWVLVDPVASISGSLGGTKPTFYQRGKELLMTDFPHPANAATTVTIVFKSTYKFVNNVRFGVMNYSSWNKDYQVTLEYYVNAASNQLTSGCTTMFNYFTLPAPVIFPLA